MNWGSFFLGVGAAFLVLIIIGFFITREMRLERG